MKFNVEEHLACGIADTWPNPVKRCTFFAVRTRPPTSAAQDGALRFASSGEQSLREGRPAV
eukprot:5197374-Prymnesium_polylepis.1